MDDHENVWGDVETPTTKEMRLSLTKEANVPNVGAMIEESPIVVESVLAIDIMADAILPPIATSIEAMHAPASIWNPLQQISSEPSGSFSGLDDLAVNMGWKQDSLYLSGDSRSSLNDTRSVFTPAHDQTLQSPYYQQPVLVSRISSARSSVQSSTPDFDPLGVVGTVKIAPVINTEKATALVQSIWTVKVLQPLQV